MQASPVPTRLYCPRWTAHKGNRRVRLLDRVGGAKENWALGSRQGQLQLVFAKGASGALRLGPAGETLLRRELERARASLALEEFRNRNLPPLEPANTPEAWRASVDTRMPQAH